MKRLVLALLGAACVLSGWVLATRPVGDEQLREQLHDRGAGVVTHVQVLDDVYTRLTIEWTDLQNRVHHDRFDTDTYPWEDGELFVVIYDARRPGLPARPSDPYYTNNGELRVDARVQGGAVIAVGVLLGLSPGVMTLRRRWWERSLKAGEVLTWRQLDLPVGPPYAWDAPGVQVRWRDYGTWATRFFVLGAAGIVVAIPMLVLIHRSDTEFVRTGVPTNGEVVDGGGHGTRHSQSHVRVRFTDRLGHPHVGDLHGPSPDELEPGDSVEVLYDAHDPERFRTKGYSNHSNFTNDAMVFVPGAAGVLLVSSLWVALTVRFGRRLMERHQWVDARVLEEDSGWWMQSRYLDLTLAVPGAPQVRTRLGMASKSAMADFSVDEGETLRICPGEGRRFLVDDQRLERPYVALLPRSARQARRWAKVAR